MDNYDQEFAEAMKLKLRLNREALQGSGASAPNSAAFVCISSTGPITPAITPPAEQ